MTTAYPPSRGTTTRPESSSPTSNWYIFDDMGNVPNPYEIGIASDIRSVTDLVIAAAPESVYRHAKSVVSDGLWGESAINSSLGQSGKTTSASIQIEPLVQLLLRRINFEAKGLAAMHRQDLRHLYEDETPGLIGSTDWGHRLAEVDVIPEDDDFDLPWG